MQVEYNTGNIEKYKSKNPLKKAMVERLNKRIIDNLVEMTEGEPVRILDAGCGEGFIDSLIINRIPNVEIVGFEFTEEAIAIAKKINPTVNYLQGDVCKMPFEDDSFDCVICTEVLEHLSDPEKALKEMLRVSRGDLLITVPHEPWFCLGNLLVLKNVRRLGNLIDHVNHWTVASFRKFLKNAKDECWKIGTSFPWIIVRYSVHSQ